MGRAKKGKEVQREFAGSSLAAQSRSVKVVYARYGPVLAQLEHTVEGRRCGFWAFKDTCVLGLGTVLYFIIDARCQLCVFCLSKVCWLVSSLCSSPATLRCLRHICASLFEF